MDLQGVDLDVSGGDQRLEFGELDSQFLELQDHSVSFLENIVVLIFQVLLGSLDLIVFSIGHVLEVVQFSSQHVDFFIVFNVNNLFNFLRSVGSQSNEFFGQSLVLSFQRENTLSEDVEFRGIAGFNLDDLFNVDGVLDGGLGDIVRSLTLFNVRDIDDVSSILRRSDGGFRSVDEGLGLSGRRTLGGGKDLADDVVTGRQLNGVFGGTRFNQGTSNLVARVGNRLLLLGNIGTLDEVLAVLVL